MINHVKAHVKVVILSSTSVQKVVVKRKLKHQVWEDLCQHVDYICDILSQ